MNVVSDRLLRRDVRVGFTLRHFPHFAALLIGSSATKSLPRDLNKNVRHKGNKMLKDDEILYQQETVQQLYGFLSFKNTLWH
jgi:hypothetical protein